MNEHKRLYNLLQLISLLSKPGGYQVQRLAKRFGVTARTVYRYFEILRECGFVLEKSGSRYRFKNAPESQNILPLFSAEEAAVINKAVLSLHPDYPIKTGLLKKLRIMADPSHLSELIVDAHASGIISSLLEAIRGQKRVILQNYHSPSSDTLLNREVDPLGFSINMKYLYAFDPDHQKTVQFKPERIGRVVITGIVFEPDERYRIEKPDLFGMNGQPQTDVTLSLNRRALHLLLEEFPESRNIIKDLEGFKNLPGLDGKAPDRTRLNVNLPVKGFDGVGRFVLGLPGEAVPLGPPEFLAYLDKRRNRSSFIPQKARNSG